MRLPLRPLRPLANVMLGRTSAEWDKPERERAWCCPPPGSVGLYLLSPISWFSQSYVLLCTLLLEYIILVIVAKNQLCVEILPINGNGYQRPHGLQATALNVRDLLNNHPF